MKDPQVCIVKDQTIKNPRFQRFDGKSFQQQQSKSESIVVETCNVTDGQSETLGIPKVEVFAVNKKCLKKAPKSPNCVDVVGLKLPGVNSTDDELTLERSLYGPIAMV